MKGKLLGTIGKFMHKNGRIIGGAVTVGGIIATGALWYLARPEIEEVVDKNRKKLEDIENDEDLTEEEKKEEKKKVTIETVKELAPVVAGPAIVTATTVITAVATVASGEKTIHNLSSAVIASDMAYQRLYDKTREVVGDEKADEIRKEVVEEDFSKKKVDEALVYECGGPVLFYDAMSGMLFRSSVDIVNKAVIECNSRLTSGQESYITLNEFYTELSTSIPETPLGEDRIWGGNTLSTRLDPNMTDLKMVGDEPAIILDWYIRPALSNSRR